MAFFIPSIQFFFGLHRALFCFGIHFSVILGNLPSAMFLSRVVNGADGLSYNKGIRGWTGAASTDRH
jgi:hypothetical protein